MLNGRKIQHGITLIESLVAIVVLSLGVLGVLGVQLRTLSDTQTSVRRAQAVRLIEDLSERIKINPDGLSNMGSYTAAWSESISGTTTNCATEACTASDLAAYDRNLWINAVRTTMPLGDANIFLAADEATSTAGRRQLGVMVSWRENERAALKTDGTADAAYTAPLSPASTGGASVSCPSGRSCHLQYVQVISRCSAYPLGGASSPRVVCP